MYFQKWFIPLLCIALILNVFIYLGRGNYMNVRNTDVFDPRIFTKSTNNVHYDKNGICKKGAHPPFNESYITEEFEIFMDVYRNKPAKNIYGTGLAHQFALWTLIRWLKPKHIIESGINHGLGTWMLRKAAPQSQLILLDPRENTGELYHDKQNDTLYFIGKKFKDFYEMDWDSLNLDLKKSLIFFDDHQSGVKRVRQAKSLGFVHAIIDDNFLPPKDNLSLKFGCAIHLGKLNSSRFSYLDNFGQVKRPFTSEDLDDIKDVFEHQIDTYFEFPFPWKANNLQNIWFPNMTWENVSSIYNLSEKDENYFNICYVRIMTTAKK